VLTRATEKPGVGAAHNDRRSRAVYRRDLQNSIYMSALGVSAGMTLAALGSCLIAPNDGPRYVAFEAPLILVSLLVSRLVRRHGRHYAVQFGMLVGMLAAVSTVACVALVPTTADVALGGVAVVPLAFAIFIPLERRLHLAWLVMVNLIFAFMPMLVSLGQSHLLALGFTAALATAMSLGANEVQLSRRHQMNGQLTSVRGLYGRMKEHELDLRRQDEFLFMQQETLVVQQAELLRLNEELETIARLDALTGLGNRLRLNEDLAQIAGRIERSGGTAGILLMDLDRFKRLNDVSGHLAGDAALRGVSDVLRKTSRVGDGLYRYGGEEFLVILHDCDETVLRSAGQRYISAIEAAGMVHPDNPPYGLVTASAGATELSQANCLDIDAALHDADEALYVAKGRGRNRLEIHGRTAKGGIVAIDKQRAAS
jgi:diguanylate cyclase (GGDEF)-like protein